MFPQRTRNSAIFNKHDNLTLITRLEKFCQFTVRQKPTFWLILKKSVEGGVICRIMAFLEPFYLEITVETKIFWWKYGGLIKTNGCKGWDGAAAD